MNDFLALSFCVAALAASFATLIRSKPKERPEPAESPTPIMDSLGLTTAPILNVEPKPADPVRKLHERPGSFARMMRIVGDSRVFKGRRGE